MINRVLNLKKPKDFDYNHFYDKISKVGYKLKTNTSQDSYSSNKTDNFICFNKGDLRITFHQIRQISSYQKILENPSIEKYNAMLKLKKDRQSIEDKKPSKIIGITQLYENDSMISFKF